MIRYKVAKKFEGLEMKRMSEKQIRKMFRVMYAPGSSTRELADWYRRDGEGPVPKCVVGAARAMRSIPKATREHQRKRVAKMRD